MRCFLLFWDVFAGGKGQGGRGTQLFWGFSRDEVARLVLKLRAGSWELGAGPATKKAEGEGQLAAGYWAGIGDNQLRVVRWQLYILHATCHVPHAACCIVCSR